MKTLTPVLAVFLTVSLSLLALPGHAQVITEVGITSSSQMPGSANDYIIFNQSQDWTDFSGSIDHVSPYSNLSSFTIVGGVASNPSDGGTITTPGGVSGVTVGDIRGYTQYVQGGSSNVAVGIDESSTPNPNFNYNDFNVYIMYSNPSLQTDAGILLESSTAYVNNPGGVGNFTPVTDNNTDPSSGYFIEFNVQGYASELAANPNGFGLALQATTGTATFLPAYINGVSFESVSIPEPSAWAMMGLGGLGLLALLSRRNLLKA